MPPGDSPVLICDLDGTILRVNSFPRWISHIVFGRVPRLGFRGRAILSLRAQLVLLRRKSGGIDHRQLMRGIQLAWHQAVEAGAEPGSERLRASLRTSVRPALLPLLREIAAGEKEAVLATAAAGEYAIGLGQDLGFRHVLATKIRLERADELNSGEQKLKRVVAFLEEENWLMRPLILLTDHIDDLPLIHYCAAVGWFGSVAAMRRAKAVANGARFIDCHMLNATALSRALSDLSAHAISFAASRSRDKTSW